MLGEWIIDFHLNLHSIYKNFSFLNKTLISMKKSIQTKLRFFFIYSFNDYYKWFLFWENRNNLLLNVFFTKIESFMDYSVYAKRFKVWIIVDSFYICKSTCTPQPNLSITLFIVLLIANLFEEGKIIIIHTFITCGELKKKTQKSHLGIFCK